ncbi:hypothetical protein SG34_020115 [Thalassomonas viridans]|uniref:Uncharacterized protein n=1 Tax=Thalassomonas viridans TaxID=137584 RepID=A0AAE9Z099_9GAMM|nr:hypothetical protein [Thalassomonas viridans]WDE03669.1 hypothetical protein SG34_020115 [Thalassomonas viridans]
MKFRDIYFSSIHYFTVGIEEDSNCYYISISVSNQRVDYEEYYKIPTELYEANKDNLGNLKDIAEECRQRLRDQDLFLEPGSDRGVPR